ncbi:hypothetical protein AGOR_G00111430 [Albula goreensis]|uniref:Uncharacterized protein n=1 Tax=Albula goreensis TaxID=1534307 RepID=A0A8T3DHJ7_9TELE|nr:hypothetical protein AGOR_G00111430 [Albula goreensis]
MGSGGSRGKKIAPASVTEVTIYRPKKDGSERDQKGDGPSVKPFKIQKLANFSRSWNGARPDCHSEGHDSDFSLDDDDDIDVELDRVMAEYENRRFNSKKGAERKSFQRSKTYGFCNSRKTFSGDFTSTPHLKSSDVTERTRVPRNHSSVKTSDKEQSWKSTHYVPNTCSGIAFQDPMALDGSEGQGLAEETVLVPGCCDAPDLTMPVILYNGSEEDLMETIEREFS